MTHRKTLFTKASILAIAATIALPSITITLPACSQSFPRERVRERRQRNLSQPVSQPSNEIFLSQSLYKPNLGPYQVNVTDEITLTDTRRNRELPVKVYYPQGLREPAPTILFSPGGGGSNRGFSYLQEFWASQGYISISISHGEGDNLRDTGETADPLEYRPQDVTFIINSLGEIERQVPQLQGKIDRSRLGLAGHSFGAYTTLWMAGQLVDTSNRPDVSYRDPRIRAFLAISPAGAGRGGLDSNAWSRITAPVLTVAGTRERGDSWRMEPFNNMPSGDKYYLLIDDAFHSSYNDFRPDGRRGRRQESETVSRIHTYLQSTSMAFWDTYLRQDSAARQVLQSTSISSSPSALPASGSRRLFSGDSEEQFSLFRK